MRGLRSHDQPANPFSESFDMIVEKPYIILCCITKTCLYNFDPLKPHFYIVKLGFTGVYIIFLISPQKHSLWVLVMKLSIYLKGVFSI